METEFPLDPSKDTDSTGNPEAAGGQGGHAAPNPDAAGGQGGLPGQEVAEQATAPATVFVGPAHPKFLRIVLPLLGIALFWNLGKAPAYLEEPRRAIVAMEMLFRDNWMVPKQLGEIYVNKPPLFNWVLMAGYRITGSYAEWLPRAVSVLSLLGMGWLVYRVGRRHGIPMPFDLTTNGTSPGDRAVAAGLLTVLCADIFFYFSTTGEIDLFYSLISLASMLAVFHYDRPGRTLALYTVPWILAALGFLTKGFPSPLFAGLTYLGWFGFRGRWKALFHPAHALGLIGFGIIAGGYFYAYSLQADLPHYLSGLFEQSSQRTAGEHAGTELVRHVLLFLPDTLKNILPASLLLPWLLSRSGRNMFRTQPLLVFCGLAFLANCWIYWISPGTRPRYVYMLYPLLVLPLAWAWRPGQNRSAHVLGALLNVLSWLLPAGIVALPLAMVSEAKSAEPLQWAVALAAGFVAWGLLRYAGRQFNPLARLILLAVLARLVFDAAVLPQRAIQGEAPVWKKNGLEVAAMTKNHPLRLLGIRDAGNFPLATAYYIERERGQVLGCDQQPEQGVWYLAEPGQLDTTLAVRHGGFRWKNFRFGLYEWRGAPVGENSGY